MGRKHKVSLVHRSSGFDFQTLAFKIICRFPHGSAHGLFPFYLFQHHFREFEAVACIRQQILVAFGQAPVDRTAHAPVSDSLNLKADQRYMVSQTVLAGAGFWSSNTF